jgi:hypothetical protein
MRNTYIVCNWKLQNNFGHRFHIPKREKMSISTCVQKRLIGELQLTEYCHDVFNCCYWKMYLWQSRHYCSTCMMGLLHVLAMLCKIFWITPNKTNGQVEDPLYSLHAHQLWILWGHLKTFVYAALLVMKRHFTIALWMPVRLSTITQASLNGCSSPWWDMLMHALNLMEDILST